MMPIPKISQYMTPAPKTIDADETLEKAGEYMRKLRVRHLPVTKNGKPIGMLSNRDISLAVSIANLDGLSMKVERFLTPNPYLTSPEEPINTVAEHMLEEKYGCVLVMEHGLLVGIFTTIDALRAIADIFRKESI